MELGGEVCETELCEGSLRNRVKGCARDSEGLCGKEI